MDYFVSKILLGLFTDNNQPVKHSPSTKPSWHHKCWSMWCI